MKNDSISVPVFTSEKMLEPKVIPICSTPLTDSDFMDTTVISWQMNKGVSF